MHVFTKAEARNVPKKTSAFILIKLKVLLELSSTDQDGYQFIPFSSDK